MFTLIFHILVISGFLVAELRLKAESQQEEAILLDFTAPVETKVPEPEKVKSEQQPEQSPSSQRTASNLAVNDAPINLRKTDKFFDDSYRKDIEEAQKVVADVNKQLSKKIPPVKPFTMPEATTGGQNPDSIKNVIYSGKSNIHYFLPNRYHVRLPIPVYLARGGGEITVNIQVNREGKVVRAEAGTIQNINDPMLPTYAVQAAERTVFNSDSKAPAIQQGTITYHFVAQ
jgi:hypothetical protein